MLRRAASNAYSWWWASHVRTKQSKWLDENLQDIEEKVQYALKLLEDEGDSFAKRAEMYYKRRPELISFVEESFKAYRALAERYDHISKELQNANTTIASVFPDQVPEFAMNEDDYSAVSPRSRKTQTDAMLSSNKNVPKVPNLPMKDSEATKMFKSRLANNKEHGGELSEVVVNKSGLSKTEAVEEIDKLQKEILVLQTEKEFVKSSYENALAKYWEIENRIMEIQRRVCALQDEFDEGAVVIEDKEAQVLMSNTALKSCQEKLDELREKHEENVKETEIIRKEISDSKEEIDKHSDDGTRTQRSGEVKKEEKEKKVTEHEVVVVDGSCLTITDVADNIDELVNDVMNLESLFSSQAALIQRLREEIDDLKAQIEALKENNNSSQSDADMRKRLREMEEKLNGINGIDKAVEEQSQNIEIHLTRAHIKLTFLSNKLKGLNQEGEEEESKDTNVPIPSATSLNDTKENIDDSVVSEDVEPASDVVIAEKENTENEVLLLSPKSGIETEDEVFLQKLLAHGIEGREKHLLTEYTKVLRNYKEVKKMLEETETRLKSENTLKDEQVRVLNHKLNLLLQGKNDGDGLQKSIAKEQQQKEQLFMLIYKEDNAINAIAGQNHMLLSPKEQLFGARVDALLSENLNLLVRFSNSFGQIQQFDTGIKDLQVELMKIIDQKNQDKPSIRSNVRPIYKHLNEIRTELTIWLEKSLLLKEEINSRASTLNNIQNEITEALKTDSEDPETKFTIYQGAKFEGEVSNMQKENNRIAEELQTGLDQVEKLQREADKTLGKLSEEFSLSESKNRSSTRSTQDSKTSIPLRSFIFDVKPKKQRLSLFSCIQPSMSKKMRPDS
ncbi:PREDICTED: protein NETWORKED 2C [Brassica oleracea var. oleracea]|uniref:NAB domain-containing protein n=1 Tax=Brassica oleracea var. oleracea TaxID=109376 RepID=A0A0D3EGF4_BRAOL|nr:PREDICTED: protein NETWORKED 2C [Brassica oleracea var. oleracea]